MSAYLLPQPQQFFDNNGDPLSGGKVYTCVPGASGYTSAYQKDTYTDATGLTTNPNPVILDSFGRCNIWGDGANYKLFIFNSSDVLIDAIDDLAPILGVDSTITIVPDDGSVTTAKLADGSVTTAKLADGAISNSEMVSSVVGDVDKILARIGSAGPVGNRSKLHNSSFVINQDNVSGTVTLAAGKFGHDRWKAGATGCTYTVSTTKGRTTINITAGSLVQTIDGRDLLSGDNQMCLSWGGSCQGRIGGGNYGSAGLTSVVTGGTNINVEFNAGTLYEPQFVPGSIAGAYEKLPLQVDLSLCQRHHELGTAVFTRVSSTAYEGFSLPFVVQKAFTPTLVIWDTDGNVGRVSFNAGGSDTPNLPIYMVAGTLAALHSRCSGGNPNMGGGVVIFNWDARAEL